MPASIEIKDDPKDPFARYALIMDGESYKAREDLWITEEEGLYDVNIESLSLGESIVQHHFSELSASIRGLKLPQSYRFVKHPHLFHIVTVQRRSYGVWIQTALGFSAADWKMPWSFSDYHAKFARCVEDQFKNYEVAAVMSTLAVSFPVKHLGNTIAEELATYPELFQRLHEKTERSLASAISQESLLMYFDFPDEVKVPCEQYLLFFTQFLKDLGVKVNTSLTENAGQVLFTVTPTDKTEALDNIRSALDVYLHLPSSPVSDSINESIAVQRLEANILRCRSDLKLAAAELQANETTIEAQRVIINVQKAMLSGEILADSMKDVTPKPEDKEHLIDGVVALSVYKEKGVEINLGELLRRLKQVFKKEG